MSKIILNMKYLEENSIFEKVLSDKLNKIIYKYNNFTINANLNLFLFK